MRLSVIHQVHTRADLQHPQRVTSRWEERPATLWGIPILL